jgi:hypothetical protein
MRKEHAKHATIGAKNVSTVASAIGRYKRESAKISDSRVASYGRGQVIEAHNIIQNPQRILPPRELPVSLELLVCLVVNGERFYTACTKSIGQK